MKKLIKNTFIISILMAFSMSYAVAGDDKDKVIKWKIAMTWGDTLKPFATVVHNFAENVETMSAGRLIIRVEGSNKHKAPFSVLDMVKSGQYEMGHTASYYWKGKDINTMPFTTMPFGMITAEQDAWYYYGGGKELAKKVYDKHKVRQYQGGNTGNQMGGWFRKEINSLEDLKGLKMRIPGFAGNVMAELGVAVLNLPAGELYTALDRGTIDALEWVGPGMDINMGFHKIAPYYYTGWHEPGTDLQFLINQRAFNKLPADLQAIVEAAITASKHDMYQINYAMSADAWSSMKKNYPHIKVKTFPPKVLEKMKEVTKRLVKEHSDSDPMFKEIIKSQQDFMKKARKWTIISDFSYLKDNLN